MADPNNAAGVLPGDPRYGLNEAQLAAYYRNKAPSWLIVGRLGEDGIARREKAMQPHIAYLRANRSRIRFAGPMFSDDGNTPIGSMTLLDAPDRATAKAYIDSEPYNLGGSFGSVEITRWSSSMEFRQLEYKRTEGWETWAITALDGPDADARRKAVAEAHHKFQASVMSHYVARGPLQVDDGTRHIGSFMIVEFPDKAAVLDFWSKEPLNYGGCFKDVKIERWKFGSAVGIPEAKARAAAE
ncbi:MAG: YciI family protein [Alphaproteobacteria bacterium]